MCPLSVDNIKNGWFENVRCCPSPNFNARPDPDDISLLVIHNISLPPGQFGTGCVQRFFQNTLSFDEHPFFQEIAGLEVSAHLLIEREGEITQFVNFEDRAWHAGQSCFEGRDNCNDFSIGIELEGEDNRAYTDAQYAALLAVTRALLSRYSKIEPARIVGHADIAPERKTDPGPAFDWSRLRGCL